MSYKTVIENPWETHLLPCGCTWRRTHDDLSGPIYWNPYNGMVQCHACGEQFIVLQNPQKVLTDAKQ